MMATPALKLVERRPGDDRLTPMERLEALCDPGSIQLIRTGVRSRRLGERAVEGDGVLAAGGRVDGRPIFCFAQDPSFLGGSLGPAHADSVVQVLRMARRAQVPVVGFIESAGARMQEGLESLGGYARIFREHVALSGLVPQISVICGASAGGGSYAPALTDYVVMVPRASMFLTGPAIVKEVMGEDVDAAALGGPDVHERNGVCQLSAPSDLDAAFLVRDLLDHLPQHAGAPVQAWPVVAPPGHLPDRAVPPEDRKVYDVRDVISAIVDGGRLLEVNARWARNVVVGHARLEGRSVGIVANQPRWIGGVLDADGATKAAKFVRTCDLLGIPLVVLVDTPGFLPGSSQEQAGVIRHGAKLVHAFAAATVPRVTVHLRKAFGGAYIAMSSRDLGADAVFAWPSAQLGVMGAKQAVGITERRALAASDDPEALRDELAAAYAEEHLTPQQAAADGFVDAVIAPSETRERVAATLALLESSPRARPHATNVPL